MPTTQEAQDQFDLKVLRQWEGASLDKMKGFLLILSISINLLASCKNGPVIKTARQGEPDIYTVTDEDKEMNDAIKAANQTIDQFKNALLSNNKNYEMFELKVRFPKAKGGEHIWLRNIIFKENKYIGIVDNVPENLNNIKLGDTIVIDNENITDWLYIDQSKLKGGYTIRLLRNRMTESERKKFDSENNFVIDEK
jgi:uncharacterized protein YegJ (DUF2314 family)